MKRPGKSGVEPTHPGAKFDVRQVIRLGAVIAAFSWSMSACGGWAHSGSERPAVVSPNATPNAHVEARPVTLKLATWNLEWLNAQDNAGPVKREAADYARLKRYAQQLNADIVAFEEVDGQVAAARVFDPAVYAFHIADQTVPQRTGFAYKKYLNVTKHPDLTQLDVGGVRRGVDLTVQFGTTKLRLLAVHLKSGCFAVPLTTASRACDKLRAQLPILEAWIDARAAEGIPFVVLGDFNRRLFASPDEAFWNEIDDGQPAESDLDAPTRGRTGACWAGQSREFVDHIVLSKSAARLVQPGSFLQQVYAVADTPYRRSLSDHCAQSVTLALAPTDAPVGSAAFPSRKTPAAPAPPRAENTLIKGNITRGHQKIYHVLGCPNYDRVRINSAEGERTFHSEAEARAAGWVKSGDCP